MKIRKIAAIVLVAVFMLALVPVHALAKEAATGIDVLVPINPTSGTVVNPPVPQIPVVIPPRAPRTFLPAPGTAILVVTDAETKLPVAGATYELYRKNPYGGKDTKVETAVTNADGRIVVSHAVTGSFYWVAAKQAEGYAADEAKHEFSVIGAQFATTEIALAKPAPEPVVEEPAIAEETAAVEESAIAEEAAA